MFHCRRNVQVVKVLTRAELSVVMQPMAGW